MEKVPTLKIDSFILNSQYRIIEKVGYGTYGSVYKIRHIKTKTDYAAKIEHFGQAKLEQENVFLQDLKHCKYVPKVYREEKYIVEGGQTINLIIMELLGPNVYQEFKTAGKCFDIQTVCNYGISMINAIREVHHQGIIHRDIKPKNMCTLSDKSTNSLHKVYFIDFGISKYYRNEKNEHIPISNGKMFCGTAEFTSLNAHKGQGQSRRDDLESIGLNLIFFINNGTLPWYNKFTGSSKNKKIRKVMETTSLDKLCSDCPQAVLDYMKYCRGLQFLQEPDYEYLKNLLKSCIKTQNKIEDINLEQNDKNQIQIEMFSSHQSDQSSDDVIQHEPIDVIKQEPIIYVEQIEETQPSFDYKEIPVVKLRRQKYKKSIERSYENTTLDTLMRRKTYSDYKKQNDSNHNDSDSKQLRESIYPIAEEVQQNISTHSLNQSIYSQQTPQKIGKTPTRGLSFNENPYYQANQFMSPQLKPMVFGEKNVNFNSVKKKRIQSGRSNIPQLCFGQKISYLVDTQHARDKSIQISYQHRQSIGRKQQWAQRCSYI